MIGGFQAAMKGGSVKGAAILPDYTLGMATWLDFSDITKVYKDATNLVNTSGDKIYSVADKSGNGKNAVALYTTNRATYRPNILNGLSVGVVEGAEVLMRLSTLIKAVPYTIVFVFKLAGLTNDQRICDGTGRVIFGKINNQSTYHIYAGGAFVQYGTANLSAHIHTLENNNNGTSKIYLDAALASSGYVGAASVNNVSLFWSSGGGSGMQIGGYIAEYRVYNSILSVENLAIVHNFLKQKWGIT